MLNETGTHVEAVGTHKPRNICGSYDCNDSAKAHARVNRVHNAHAVDA